jgi:hypothetical protein
MNKVLTKNELIVLSDKSVWVVVKRIPKNKTYELKAIDGTSKSIPFGTDIKKLSDLLDKINF